MAQAKPNISHRAANPSSDLPDEKAARRLADLNLELAADLTLLAAQSEDSVLLIPAVKALRYAQDVYQEKAMPRENAKAHELLGNTLLTLGRAQGDIKALRSAVESFRAGIALASMLGDEPMRRALKRNYQHTRDLIVNLQGCTSA